MVNIVTLLAFVASSFLSGFFEGVLGITPVRGTARIERLEKVCSEFEKIVNNRGPEFGDVNNNGVIAVSKEKVEQKSGSQTERGVVLLKDVDLSENNKKGGILGTLVGGVWNLSKWVVRKTVALVVGSFAFNVLYSLLDTRISTFARKCKLNQIDSCDRNALHEKKYMGQTEMWSERLVVLNPYKLELLKQYFSHVLHLGWYRNKNVGKK